MAGQGGVAVREPSLGENFSRPNLNEWLGMVAHACHPKLSGEAQIGRLWSRHKERPYLKNN
jgi:hypothetical protein